jgi:hypothetical protein
MRGDAALERDALALAAFRSHDLDSLPMRLLPQPKVVLCRQIKGRLVNEW